MPMMLRSTLLGAVLAAGLALPAAAQSVLRVVPHADLRTLDPVAVSVTITRMHGLMIYETLFAWDAALQPKPQMVDTWSSATISSPGVSRRVRGSASTTARP